MSLACLVEGGFELRDFCLHAPPGVCALRELRLTGREDRTNLGELLRGGCGCGLGRIVLFARRAQGCLKSTNLRLHGRSSLGAFCQLGVTRCKILTKLASSPGFPRESLSFGARLLEHALRRIVGCALLVQRRGSERELLAEPLELGLDRSAGLHVVGAGLFTSCELGADGVQLGFHLRLQGGATGQLSLTCGKAGSQVLELRLQRLRDGCVLRQLGVSPFKVSAKFGCDLLQARQLCCGLSLRIRVVGLRGALSPLVGFPRQSFPFGARLLEHSLRSPVGCALLVQRRGGVHELLVEPFELGLDRGAGLHFVGAGFFKGCELNTDGVQLVRRGGELGVHLGLRGGATGQLSLTCGKADPEILELRLQRLPGGCALRQFSVSSFKVSAKFGCDLLQARQLGCGLRLRIHVVGLSGALSPLVGFPRESFRFGARLLEHALRPIVGRALLVEPAWRQT